MAHDRCKATRRDTPSLRAGNLSGNGECEEKFRIDDTNHGRRQDRESCVDRREAALEIICVSLFSGARTAIRVLISWTQHTGMLAGLSCAVQYLHSDTCTDRDDIAQGTARRSLLLRALIV